MQVTLPVEQHRDGSAPSDSEEDFDRERQHSVLPHKAGDQPFRSKILTLEDDGEVSHEYQARHLAPYLPPSSSVACSACNILMLQLCRPKLAM